MIDKELLSNVKSDLSSVKEDVCSAHDELDSIIKFVVPKQQTTKHKLFLQ